MHSTLNLAFEEYCIEPCRNNGGDLVNVATSMVQMVYDANGSMVQNSIIKEAGVPRTEECLVTNYGSTAESMKRKAVRRPDRLEKPKSGGLKQTKTNVGKDKKPSSTAMIASAVLVDAIRHKRGIVWTNPRDIAAADASSMSHMKFEISHIMPGSERVIDFENKKYRNGQHNPVESILAFYQVMTTGHGVQRMSRRALEEKHLSPELRKTLQNEMSIIDLACSIKANDKCLHEHALLGQTVIMIVPDSDLRGMATGIVGEYWPLARRSRPFIVYFSDGEIGSFSLPDITKGKKAANGDAAQDLSKNTKRKKAGNDDAAQDLSKGTNQKKAGNDVAAQDLSYNTKSKKRNIHTELEHSNKKAKVDSPSRRIPFSTTGKKGLNDSATNPYFGLGLTDTMLPARGLFTTPSLTVDQGKRLQSFKSGMQRKENNVYWKLSDDVY